MGKSGKKPRESHRQGRGRRASHFDDEGGDYLPSSAYDAPPPHHNCSSDDDNTNEATAEDEREEDGEAGEQDQCPAGSMPSKFHLYQLSVQVNRLASAITCVWLLSSQLVRLYVNACNVFVFSLQRGTSAICKSSSWCTLAGASLSTCRRISVARPSSGESTKHDSLCTNVLSIVFTNVLCATCSALQSL
jgi:hypothetical protein